MAELIERDLLCHSLNQHLRQGLCKGDEKMNCAMTGLNPYSFMKGFEYGMQLAQTIVSNRPTTTEAEIRADVLNEVMAKAREIQEEQIKIGHGGMDWLTYNAFVSALIDGSEMPIDIYDAATWQAVTVLSEMSIQQGGMPQEMPDFTGGKWADRPFYRREMG